MAKVLKIAALVVGAVALAVATAGVGDALAAGFSLGTALGTAAGASLAGISAGLSGVTVGAMLAVSAGLSVAAGLLAKKPTAVNGGSQSEFSADPNAGVPYWIGDTGTSGSIVARLASDGFAGNSENDLNDFVVVLSLGPIEGIEYFTSDKNLVTFDAGGDAVGTYRDVMFQKVQLGQCPEPAALMVQAGSSFYPTGWTPAHKLSGLAAAIWRLCYDSKKQIFYENGPPKPVWKGKGVKVYDPRKDSTYPGGSGAHRWNDETTWEWSENPHLHALTWCIGRHQNGKRVMGLGAKIDQIIVEQFVEGANISEANGWKVGGVIYSRPDTKWNNLKLILQAGASEPLRVGARIGCMINTPRVSLETITIDDIVDDAQLSTVAAKRGKLNTVTPRYRSADNDWGIVPAAPIAVPEYVLADGDPKSAEIEYTLVQDVNQAATMARYDIENSREFGPGTFPLKPKWLNFKGGDCVTLNIPDVENQKVLFLTRDVDPPTAVVTFTVRSETDGKHAFALGQTGVAPPTPSIGAYDPTVGAPFAGDWTLTGSTLTDNGVSIPALVATGHTGNNLADAVIWDLRVYVPGAGDDDNWSGAGVEAPVITRKEFTGLTPGTQYEVSVRYRVLGFISARRILSVVTSGNFATPGEISSAIRIAVVKAVAPLLSAADVSGAGFVTIGASTWDYPNKAADVTRTGGSVTGLDLGTRYHLYFDDETLSDPTPTYFATTDFATALNSTSNPYRHYLDFVDVPAAGMPPSPGSGGGGGGYCPDIAAPVLMDGYTTKPAGDLVPGDVVWTKHELTGVWGAFPVAAVEVFDCDDMFEGKGDLGELRASGSHLVWHDGAWRMWRLFASPAAPGQAVKITVADAHTYVVGGRLSHNKLVDGPV